MVLTPSLRSIPTVPYPSNAVPERSNVSTSVVFAPIGSRATTRLPPKEEQSVISSLVRPYVSSTSVLASSFPSTETSHFHSSYSHIYFIYANFTFTSILFTSLPSHMARPHVPSHQDPKLLCVPFMCFLPRRFLFLYLFIHQNIYRAAAFSLEVNSYNTFFTVPDRPGYCTLLAKQRTNYHPTFPSSSTPTWLEETTATTTMRTLQKVRK